MNIIFTSRSLYIQKTRTKIFSNFWDWMFHIFGEKRVLANDPIGQTFRVHKAKIKIMEIPKNYKNFLTKIQNLLQVCNWAGRYMDVKSSLQDCVQFFFK